MPRSPVDARHRLATRLLAAGSTALVLALFLGGAFHRLCAWSYDLHFRILGGPVPASDIVLIDIDDDALRQMGRWPWDRRVLAELTSLLDALGARVIALDLMLYEDQPLRFEPQSWAMPPPDAVGALLPELDVDVARVDDDAELAAAIARSGRVVLPASATFVSPAAAPEHAASGNAAPTNAQPSGIQALIDVFSLTQDQWAAQAGESATMSYAICKRRAAAILAERYIDARDDADAMEFRRLVLGEATLADETPDAAELVRAFDAALARHVWRQRTPTVTAVASIHAGEPSGFPLTEFVRSARAIGNVTIPANRFTDAVVREAPLLTMVDGRAFPHFSLAVAAAALGVDIDHPVATGGRIQLSKTSPKSDAPPSDADHGAPLPTPSASREISRLTLSVDGMMSIPWARPRTGDGPAWLRTFEHVPVTRLLEIIDQRNAAARNADRQASLRSMLVEAANRGSPGMLPQYRQHVRERNQLLRSADLAQSSEEREQLLLRAGQSASLTTDIEERAQAWLDGLIEPCKEAAADHGGVPDECADVAALAEFLSPEARGRHEALQESLKRKAQEGLDALRSKINGRICLVGVVATGVPDFVATPLDAQTPGVVVHAHMISALLTGQSIQQSPPGIDAGALVIAGALASLAAGRMSFRRGAAVLALCIVATLGLAAWRFTRSGWIHAWPVVLLGAFAPWVCVTAYRRVSEERQRRRLTHVLGQYTSAPIAAQVARDLGSAPLDPKRCRLTCFFCDLADFTSAAERLDPEDVRGLLQPYLATVSDALIARRALVNKFIGDGVFAFFNAPVLACEDHAAQACRAALETLARLSANAASGSITTAALYTRVGLATGHALVGDFGTERKRDYTAIGDVVNVASRLEAANKTLHTRILADEATQQSAGPGFAWRRVGRLLVAGREGSVTAFELRGDSDTAPHADWAMIECFEKGLERFAERDWPGARSAWAECARIDPHDGVVRFYLGRLHEIEHTSLSTNWAGEVRIDDRSAR